jgi:tetratricopeptide (TPR) repeat protein
MTQCPVCGAAAKPTAPECACGESLAPWRTITASGSALRDHGLALAAAGDFLGAAVVLLEAALTNPLDAVSLVDAARAMIRLGRGEDAARWLEAAKSAPGAAALLAVARQQGEEATPSEEHRPPRLPLLAIPPIPRQAGGLFSGKRADKTVLAAWEQAIRMEAEPGHDWRPRGSPLEDLVRTDPRAVYHYALGLGECQSGNRPAAADAFRRCIAADPPVLNPAAYLVYIYVGEPKGLAVVWEELQKRYSAKELEHCRAALQDRLARRP